MLTRFFRFLDPTLISPDLAPRLRRLADDCEQLKAHGIVTPQMLRKAMTRLWAKREEQLSTVLETTVGLYGDLQGIAGRAMPEIESLDVLAISTSSEPSSA
ncbi:hypothetical protein BST63_02155 [Bradyrhizobium canariense]|uniref:Uncharacterized protein n=1 Tax=Bradyrhizobium canariense TaxID=255045 RepID=A0ABX3XBC9_9BRAD|nr:hypothetical protein BSR47_02470 [Bradyrhizobium canariense]OSJ35290.1 hypothetical protein BST63_02155 [Bradyrhizobium canariense]